MKNFSAPRLRGVDTQGSGFAVFLISRNENFYQELALGITQRNGCTAVFFYLRNEILYKQFLTKYYKGVYFIGAV